MCIHILLVYEKCIYVLCQMDWLVMPYLLNTSLQILIVVSLFISNSVQFVTSGRLINKYFVQNKSASKTQQSMASLSPAFIIVIITMIMITVYNQAQQISPQIQSIVYRVEFKKTTGEQFAKIRQSGAKVLSQVDFLEKMARNAAEVFNQTFLYVAYDVPVISLNISNFTNYSNRNIEILTNSEFNQNIPSYHHAYANQSETQQLINQQESPNLAVNNNLNKYRVPSTKANFAFVKSVVSTIQIKKLNQQPLKSSQKTSKSSQYQYPLSSSYKNSNQSTIKKQSLPLPPSPSPPSTPITPQPTSSSSQFKKSSIALHNQLPIRFIRNETYKIGGYINNDTLINILKNNANNINMNANTNMSINNIDSIDNNIIKFIFAKIQTQEELICADAINQKFQFYLSCRLDLSGFVYVSVWIGSDVFHSKRLRNIYEIPPLITYSETQPPIPLNLSLQILQGNLILSWESKSPLTKLIISQPVSQQTPQNSQQFLTIQYILSNWHTSFKIPHEDFSLFEQQKTTITISHAKSKDGTLHGITSLFGDMLQVQFNAVQHLHFNNQQGLYRFIPALEDKVKLGTELVLTMQVQTIMRQEVYLVTPFKEVRKVYFEREQNKKTKQSGVVVPGEKLKLKLKFDITGAWLLQINQFSGLAIVNQPVYVGDVFPLVPDYMDIKLSYLLKNQDPIPALISSFISTQARQITLIQPAPTSQIQKKREYLLTLLNLLRGREISNPVYLDKTLTQIAQNHSDDMNANNYFSHNNLAGEGPGQRARKRGFYGAIGENVALSGSLIQGHLSLERSATHFENSVNWVWTRVGIGIARNMFGFYLITYQFSSRDILLQPLQKKQLQFHQSQLSKLVASKIRIPTPQNTVVSQLILEWLQSNRTLPLIKYINSKDIRQKMTESMIKFTYYPKFVEEIEKSVDFLQGADQRLVIGFGVNLATKKDDPTVIQCVFVYLEL